VSNDDRGSVALVAIGIIAILLAACLWLGVLASAFAARLVATTAADAAALAAAPVTFLPFGAAGSPSDEAMRFAHLNGTELLSCDCAINRSFAPRTVTVRVARRVELLGVRFPDAQAIGRAEFVPARLLEQVRPG
jgi:hypothetical protein